MIEQYVAIFNALATERAGAFKFQHGLAMKSGEGLGAAIIKVLKPSWTTDPAAEFLNSNGVFFSVWVDEACEANGIARYNLHAKKLRFLKGERFEARQFVRSFRDAMDLSDWPNASFPKGPITLFEGHVTLNVNSLKAEASGLLDKFANLVPMLDEMLRM